MGASGELWWEWSTAGAGRPWLLLHGTMDRSTSFGRVARLAPHRRILRYDRRGYGRSVGLGSPRQFADQVDDLVAVLTAAGADRGSLRPLVFGHSYGGVVALATAARHPDLLAGLVAYESPLPWLDWWPTSSAGARAASGDGDPGDAAEAFMRRVIGDERWVRLPRSTRDARRAEGATLVAELAQLRPPSPVPVELSEVTCPVLAAHGADGLEHHRRAAEHTAAAVADGALATVAGATHGVHLSHPSAVVDLLADLEARVDS